MKQIILATAFCLPASFAHAQDKGTEPSLMERGAQLLMEGIMKELAPTIEGFEELGPELRDFATEMGPVLVDLLKKVKDWSVYEVPEILPNGDIIIRRKPQTPDDDGAVDL